LGLVFHALEQFERALVSFDEGLRLDPDDTILLNRRGVALLAQMSAERAEQLTVELSNRAQSSPKSGAGGLPKIEDRPAQ
jgi:hypothetical protein